MLCAPQRLSADGAGSLAVKVFPSSEEPAMPARAAATTLFLISLFFAAAAEAKCKPGSAPQQASMCAPCGEEQYVAGDRCRTCPEGFTTNGPQWTPASNSLR